jgi:hypothetical protein
MGPYAGFDFNLTLCPLMSRLQHIYHGQPCAKVDLNPMSVSTLSDLVVLGFHLKNNIKKNSTIHGCVGYGMRRPAEKTAGL